MSRHHILARLSGVAVAIVTLSSLAAPARACAVLTLAVDRHAAGAHVAYNFTTDAISAYRVMLKDITTPGPWMVILGPAPAYGAPVAVANDYTALNVNCQYILRVDVRCGPPGTPWTIGVPTAPF
jgi:hypothetical protein